MNPTILIRSVAATLAATTLLLAQSAPQPRAASRSAAPGNERMQVRLAEVIAMLEEDDLTPAQRAEAKKKLEEIRARLRAESTPPPPKPPAAPRGVDVAPAAPDEAVDVFEAKPTPRAGRRVLAPVVPDAPMPQEPTPPPSAPKAAKAPKAPKPPKAEVLELTDVTETKPVEVRRLGGEGVIVKKGEGGDVVFVKPQGGEGQGVRAYTLKTAEGEHEIKLQELKAKVDEGQRRVRVQQEGLDRLLVETKAREPMVLHLDGAKVQLEGAKARLDGAKIKLDDARERLEATVRADELAQRGHRDAAKAAEENGKRARVLYTEAKERAEADAERVHTYTVRERAAEAAREEFRARAAQPKAKESAGFDELPVRGRILRSKVADDGDGDAQIRKLIEEMRAEMREIRKLIEQMRKQSVSAAKRPAEGGVFGQFVPGIAAPRAFSGFAGQGLGGAEGQAGAAPRSSSGSTNVRSRRASSFGSGRAAGGSGSSTSAVGVPGGSGIGGGGETLQVHSTGIGGVQSSSAPSVFHLAPGTYSVGHQAAPGELQPFKGSTDVK